MVLKTKLDSGVVSFIDIGRQFQKVMRQDAPDQFEETFKIFFGESGKDYREHCFGFVIHNNGADVQPLYKGQVNSIMSDSVQMFLDLNPD